MNIRSLSELKIMEIPDIEWIIPDILPGYGLGMIYAANKSGKSTLAYNIMMDGASGRAMLGLPHYVRFESSYFDYENADVDIANRVRRITGGDVSDNTHIITGGDTLDGSLIDDMHKMIDTHPHMRMVVLDSYERIQSHRRSGQESSVSKDRGDMQLLRSVALERHVLVLLVHHKRKKSGGDFMDSASGTHGLLSECDTIIELDRPRFSDMATLRVSGRAVREDAYRVVFENKNGHYNYRVKFVRDVKTEARQEVIDALHEIDDIATPDMVATVTGRSPGSVRKLMGIMAEDGEIIKVSYGKYTIHE